MKTVPLAEAKAKLGWLIDDVARRDKRITITKRGRPAAPWIAVRAAPTS